MSAEYNPRVFGAELRSNRLALGWTAKQLALLYSEAIGREENPVDASFIFHLESGKDILVDKGRRLLLARLVDMPLALAGAGLLISNAPSNPFGWERVDLKDYATTLEIYCDTWQQGTTYKVIKDIRKRLRSLERATLYSSTREKPHMIELLCRYQMLAADIASEQAPRGVNQILMQTVALSYENERYNTYAYALRQRAGISIDIFEETKDFSILKKALGDFQAAEAIESHVSPFYQAMVDIRRGLMYAYLALDQDDFTKALNIIDSANRQIGKQKDDKHIAARLDKERYKLNRASAYLYSPQGSPILALKELNDLVDMQPNPSPRRRVHRDLLFAETYMNLKNYPMAVSCATEAIEVSSTNGMDTLFNRLENVYHALRSIPYGKDPEVARLGVQILKARQPEIFTY